MHSYGNLWNAVIDYKNIEKAILKSSRGKRHEYDGLSYLMYNDPCLYFDPLVEYAENYKNDKHHPVEIYDGMRKKKRTIIVPSYHELVIQHMVVQVLQPIFMKGMYEHTYGPIPKRGVHKAAKVIARWIKEDGKNCKYCLQMDIQKFFDSIPHDIIKSKLNKIIRDKKLKKLLFKIIDVTDIGLPLGFYTSQWLSAWFLQDLDHWIKQTLGAKHYLRFADDMVIFGSSKRELHQMQEAINAYLHIELGLKMKDNWQVFRFEYKKKGEYYGRPLDFIGFEFHRDRVLMRKSIMFKMTRKASKIYKKKATKSTTIYDCRQIMSYLGWLKSTDTHKVYVKYVKGKINFGTYRKRISKHDRKLIYKLNKEIVGD
jgi:hypothetical protein